MNRREPAITPAQQMLSSCAGAVITSVFVTPLDVVKIRLQAQQKGSVAQKCFLYCNDLMEHICYCVNRNGYKGTTGIATASFDKQWYKSPGHFDGTLDAFVKITRNEGVSSLWSGLPPTLVMAVPGTVVYYTMYDQLKFCLNRRLKTTSSQPAYIPALAGALARIIAATVISPLELVRTKMQSTRLSYKELSTVVQNQVRTQGVLCLWRGLGPTLLRDVPFSAIYWIVYENLKRQFHQEKNPKFICSFTFGAVAGSVAGLSTAPFDIIKTHRQIDLGDLEALREQRKMQPTFKLVTELYQSRGFSALYAGTVPRLIKIAPACAIMISTYEFGKTFFQCYNRI